MKSILAAAAILASAAGAHAQFLQPIQPLQIQPLQIQPIRPMQPMDTGPYGNSATSPRIYDSQGNFRGNYNSNTYDPNSVANPYSRYYNGR